MKTKFIVAAIACCMLGTPTLAQEAKKVTAVKVEVKPGVTTKVVVAPKGDVKLGEAKTAVTAETKTEPKATLKTDVKAVPASQPAKVEVKVEPKAEAKTSTSVSTETTTTTTTKTTEVQPPVNPDDVVSIIREIIKSAKTGKWALLVGLIVMMMTWLVNKILKQKIPASVMPWLAIGLSTIAAISFALATGVTWVDAIVVGVQNGLAAAGSWSAVGKYIPGLVPKDPPATGSVTGAPGSPA